MLAGNRRARRVLAAIATSLRVTRAGPCLAVVAGLGPPARPPLDEPAAVAA
jgi:hypothetical protein